MYIVFEGPEAVGKSTQMRRFADSDSFLLTREPGSPHSDVCKALRSVIMHPDVVEAAALFSFLADRAQHMRSVVIPAISAGRTVFSDRSSLSSIIYHLADIGDHIDYDYLGGLLPAFDLAQVAAPDFMVLFSANYEWATSNLLARGQQDRIEKKGERFIRRVHHLFDSLKVPSEFGDFLKSNLRTFPRQIVVAPRSDLNSEGAVYQGVLGELTNLAGGPLDKCSEP